MKKLVFILFLSLCYSNNLSAQGAGNALSFDGSGDFVSVPDKDDWTFSDFTISLWVKANTWSGEYYTRPFLSHDEGQGMRKKWIFAFNGTSSGGRTLFHTIGSASVNIVGDSWTPEVNTWYFITITRSSNTYKFYINGNSNGETTNSVVIVNANAPLRIGAAEYTPNFNGVMDEIRIWNTALSQSTIQAWKDVPLNSSHPNWSNLIAYYQFNEDMVGQSSGTVYDSKNDNDGTNIGATWVVNSDLSLPVELSSFSAEYIKSGVLLKWTTESEMDNLGFFIDRRENDQDSWERIASYQNNNALKGQGTTSSQTFYEYLDTRIVSNTTYQYRLASVDVNGQTCYSETIEVSTNGMSSISSLNEVIPDKFELMPAYPNPFNPQTTIRFSIPHITPVKLNIYNVKGELVNQLANRTMNTGIYEYIWNGIDKSGIQVPSGLYLVRIEAGGFVKVRKVLLAK